MLLLTSAVNNDFLWKNLYTHRFGQCTYPPPTSGGSTVTFDTALNLGSSGSRSHSPAMASHSYSIGTDGEGTVDKAEDQAFTNIGGKHVVDVIESMRAALLTEKGSSAIGSGGDFFAHRLKAGRQQQQQGGKEVVLGDLFNQFRLPFKTMSTEEGKELFMRLADAALVSFNSVTTAPTGAAATVFRPIVGQTSEYPPCSMAATWSEAFRARVAFPELPFFLFFVQDNRHFHFAQVIAFISMLIARVASDSVFHHHQVGMTGEHSPKKLGRISSEMHRHSPQLHHTAISGFTAPMVLPKLTDIILLYERGSRNAMNLVVTAMRYFTLCALKGLVKPAKERGAVRHVEQFSEPEYQSLFHVHHFMTPLCLSRNDKEKGAIVTSAEVPLSLADGISAHAHASKQLHPLAPPLLLVTAYSQLHGTAWCRPLMSAMCSFFEDPKIRLYFTTPKTGRRDVRPPTKAGVLLGMATAVARFTRRKSRRKLGLEDSVTSVSTVTPSTTPATDPSADAPPLAGSAPQSTDINDILLEKARNDFLQVRLGIVAAITRFTSLLAEHARSVPPGISYLITKMCIHVNVHMLNILTSSADSGGAGARDFSTVEETSSHVDELLHLIFNEPVQQQQVVSPFSDNEEGVFSHESSATNPLVRDVRHFRLAKLLLFEGWILPMLLNVKRYGFTPNPTNVSQHMLLNIEAFVWYFRIFVTSPFSQQMQDVEALLPEGSARTRIPSFIHGPYDPLKGQATVPDTYVIPEELMQDFLSLNTELGIVHYAESTEDNIAGKYALPSPVRTSAYRNLNMFCSQVSSDEDASRVVEEYRVPDDVTAKSLHNIYEEAQTAEYMKSLSETLWHPYFLAHFMRSHETDFASFNPTTSIMRRPSKPVAATDPRRPTAARKSIVTLETSASRKQSTGGIGKLQRVRIVSYVAGASASVAKKPPADAAKASLLTVSDTRLAQEAATVAIRLQLAKSIFEECKPHRGWVENCRQLITSNNAEVGARGKSLRKSSMPTCDEGTPFGLFSHPNAPCVRQWRGLPVEVSPTPRVSVVGSESPYSPTGDDSSSAPASL